MGERIHLEVAPECHGCGVCRQICTRGAITISDVEAKPRAVIEHAKCILCLACVDICPVEAILEPYPPKWRKLSGS